MSWYGLNCITILLASNNFYMRPHLAPLPMPKAKLHPDEQKKIARPGEGQVKSIVLDT